MLSSNKRHKALSEMKKEKRTRRKEEKETERWEAEGQRERSLFFGETNKRWEKCGRKRNLRDKTEAENFQCFNGWSCLQLTVHIATIWLHGQTIVGFFIPIKKKKKIGFFILLLKPKYSWTYICWGPKFFIFYLAKWWSIY